MHLSDNTLLQRGKYRIIHYINGGGFGYTYEAEHVMLHKRVAIKEFFYKKETLRNADNSISIPSKNMERNLIPIKKKFIEEAIFLSQANHPNIISVTDVFEENETAYYVMDYIDGKSLSQILKEQGTLTETQAVDYICQVAEALKYVHSFNRLHLDIKPDNILVDSHSGRAILIDFGTCKHYDENSGEQTTGLLGMQTDGYAPIELANKTFSNFSPSTDVYELGATLYCLLSGVKPPIAASLSSGDEVIKPLPSHISANTRHAVECSLKLRRKDRPQSVDELVAMLSEKQSVSTNNVSRPLEGKNIVVVDEETIIDSSNKPVAKSPKCQKSDQEIKDAAWEIAKKYPLGFREYNGEYEGSLEDVSYCRMVIRDKSLIMRGNQRLSKNQDYNADAQKLYKKYGEVVRFEDCKKILMEEKGNFAIAEQRVAKCFVNKKSAKPGTKAYYAEYTKYIVSLLFGIGSMLIVIYFGCIGTINGIFHADLLDSLQWLGYCKAVYIVVSLCCFAQMLISKDKRLNAWAFTSSLFLLSLGYSQMPFFASYFLCGNYLICALMYAIRTDTWKAPSVLGLLYFIIIVFLHIFSKI